MHQKLSAVYSFYLLIFLKQSLSKYPSWPWTLNPKLSYCFCLQSVGITGFTTTAGTGYQWLSIYASVLPVLLPNIQTMKSRQWLSSEEKARSMGASSASRLIQLSPEKGAHFLEYNYGMNLDFCGISLMLTYISISSENPKWVGIPSVFWGLLRKLWLHR